MRARSGAAEYLLVSRKRTPAPFPDEAGTAISQPPEYPSSPNDPHPGDYPPPGYETPPPGYAPPPAGQPFRITDAFNWAFNKFGKNAGPLILSTLVYGLFGVILEVLLISVVGGLSTSATSTQAANGAALGAGFGVAGNIVFQITMAVVVAVVQAGYLSGALDIADGRPVTVGTFLQPRNLGTVVTWAALLAVVGVVLNAPSLIGGWAFVLLSFVAGLVFGFFSLFTIAYVVDRDLPALAALKASYTAVTSNVGAALLSYLLQFLVVLVGALLCGLGLIVAVPVAILIQVYTYRRLSDGVVAPVTP
jgi:uncharacterized membrane protein